MRFVSHEQYICEYQRYELLLHSMTVKGEICGLKTYFSVQQITGWHFNAMKNVLELLAYPNFL